MRVLFGVEICDFGVLETSKIPSRVGKTSGRLEFRFPLLSSPQIKN